MDFLECTREYAVLVQRRWGSYLQGVSMAGSLSCSSAGTSWLLGVSFALLWSLCPAVVDWLVFSERTAQMDLFVYYSACMSTSLCICVYVLCLTDFKDYICAMCQLKYICMTQQLARSHLPAMLCSTVQSQYAFYICSDWGSTDRCEQTRGGAISLSWWHLYTRVQWGRHASPHPIPSTRNHSYHSATCDAFSELATKISICDEFEYNPQHLLFFLWITTYSFVFHHCNVALSKGRWYTWYISIGINFGYLSADWLL